MAVKVETSVLLDGTPVEVDGIYLISDYEGSLSVIKVKSINLTKKELSGRVLDYEGDLMETAYYDFDRLYRFERF